LATAVDWRERPRLSEGLSDYDADTSGTEFANWKLPLSLSREERERPLENIG